MKRMGRMAVHALCVLALAAIGFAHVMPTMVADAGNVADLAAYRLPDGSLPSLCVTDNEGTAQEKQHHHLVDRPCPACRINASTLLPSPPATAMSVRDWFFIDAPESAQPLLLVHELALLTLARPPPTLMTV
ncbi:hypothetical protein [Allorhizobium sonneratiae]|uniref:hypothetical protein n=1 Tax=Allorhizobium sonneratiae TaxID=2934936 RepID=UPI0020332C27|nr:hypothetical protein [Allorhizobium sonneratiae]